MSTYYHTAISTGAAANAATFNGPLGTLDAAIHGLAFGDGAIASFSAADATPSVAAGNFFQTANIAATTITMFDGGTAGQTIYVVINDAFTTVDFTGGHLIGNRGQDWYPANGDHMICTFDGTDWYCRVSNNTTSAIRGIFHVEDYGAVGIPGTDDHEAIQDAIDAAAASGKAATVVFGSKTYQIDEDVIVSTNGVVLQGTSGLAQSAILLGAAGASVVFQKPASAILYQAGIENIGILGNNTGEVGLYCDNLNEGFIRNVHILQCTVAGLHMTGANCGLLPVKGLQMNGNATAIYINSGGSIWFDNCNIYDSDVVMELTGTVYNVIMRDSWIETFETGILFDSTDAGLGVYDCKFYNNYWLSGDGGETFDCRIIKSMAPNNTYQNTVRALILAGSHIYTTAAKYVVEVDWDGNTKGGSNRFIARLEDNYFHGGSNYTAWLGSDMVTSGAPFVHVHFGYNLGPDTLAMCDSTFTEGTFLTGLMHVDYDYAPLGLVIGYPVEYTIDTGAITIKEQSYITVDTEDDDASDDLDTISGGRCGQVLMLHAANSARTVVAKDNTGNLQLAGDCTLDNAEDTLTLLYNGADWLEIARSNNGA